MKLQSIKLLFTSEFDILPVASQIAQPSVVEGLKSDDPKYTNLTLDKYTDTQLLLAEENSTQIRTDNINNSIYLCYLFADKSEIKFKVKTTV